MDRTRLDWARWFAVALLIVLGWINFRYMILYTMHMFSEPVEDMSHGWVVPFVSAFVMWRQRRAFREAAGAPSWAGFLFVCLFMVLCWFGSRGMQSRVEQVSLIGLLWAIPYAFWGPRVARLMLFPAGYLAFTIPVSSFTDFFTIHLRILSSAIATGVLNGLGVSVERAGTALFSRAPGAEFNLDVADPCSGIRSLFAMMALTAAYAYFTQKTLARKWALFACSLPLAMIGNMFRIFSICLMATWFGQEVATGFYHDYSGYVVFLVGVFLMIEAGRAIERVGERFSRLSKDRLRASEHSTVSAPMASPAAARAGGAAVAGVVFLMALAVYFKTTLPAPVFDAADFVTEALPQSVGEFVGDVPLFCHNEQCVEVVSERRLRESGRKEEEWVCPSCGGKLHRMALGEATDLPKDTVILKRNYRASDGLVYAVSVVVGGRSRGSIHRPELCLPAQGYVMLDAGKLRLSLPAGGTHEARKITAQRPGGDRLTLVYWFMSKQRESCSHLERILTDVWDRSLYNRINRWVMVAVNLSSPLDTPESVARFEAFMDELYPKVIHAR